MSIRLSCDNCGSSYRLKDTISGRKFRCQDCDTLIQIPAVDDAEDDFSNGTDSVSEDWELSARPPLSGRRGLSRLLALLPLRLEFLVVRLPMDRLPGR